MPNSSVELANSECFLGHIWAYLGKLMLVHAKGVTPLCVRL